MKTYSTYTGRHIESLDFLKAFLIFTVLAEHYFGTVCFDNVNKESFPLLFWFSEIINAFFRGQSVPVYFFISGYLFFLGGNFSLGKYFNKVRNRIKSLLIPYVIWNSIAIIMLLILLSSSFTSMMRYGDYIDFSVSNLLSCYWIYDGNLAGVNIPSSTAPLNMPLWYVRDLMLLIVISPAIRWFLKNTGVVFLMIACGLWIYTSVETPQIYYPWEGMFFFSSGAYFSINGREISTVVGRNLIPYSLFYFVFSIALTIGGYYDVDNIFYIKFPNIILGLLFFVSFFERISHGNLINRMRKYFGCAFFIYLSHGLINSKFIKMMIFAVKPDNDTECIFVLLFSYFSNILLLYAIYKLLERFYPRVLNLITGR